MRGLLAKLSRAIKKSARSIFFLVPKALIYPIKKPLASFDEVKHNVKVSLKKAIGLNIPKKEIEYNSSVGMTEASKSLGIEMISYKDGKIKFLASRVLAGDIPHLTLEQLAKIKVLANVDVLREENRVIVEVDIDKITNDVKNSSKYKGKSSEEIKSLILKRIGDRVDRNLKDLARITDGELKYHTDQKLLYGIARKLYWEYNSQIGYSEAVRGFNMTNPNQFPFVSKETISPIKMQLSQDMKSEIRKCGGDDISNFPDVFGKLIKTPSISAKNEGKEKG